MTKKKKRLQLTVTEQRDVEQGILFTCSIQGEAIKADRYVFYVAIPLLEDGELIGILIPFAHTITMDGSVEFARYTPVKPMGKLKGTQIDFFGYTDDFIPIAGAIEEYSATPSGRDNIVKTLSSTMDSTALGSLLQEILGGAGYAVEIIKPIFYYAPTVDRAIQQIYTTDKRGNFLAELLSFSRKEKELTPILDDDQKNVVGFKIDVDIPSKREVDKPIQLHLDFDFRQEDGFKLVPIDEMNRPETKAKLNNLLQEMERKIAKDLDPLTLRVKDAILCLAQDKASRKFDYSEDELMDLLYKKEKRKAGGEYRGTRNKKRVRERLPLISNIKLTYSVRIGRDIIGIKGVPHVILNPEGEPFVEHYSKKGKLKKKYNFQSIEIPERYWNLFYEGKYVGQYARESLKLIGSSYLIYKYIATWWRIEWMNKKGIYEWNLVDILMGAGISLPPQSQKARFIKKFIKTLDDMKRDGLLGSYKRLQKNRDPIADRWQFEAPKALKKQFERIGVEYQRTKKIKELKAEKKELKLEADVIDLKSKRQDRQES